MLPRCPKKRNLSYPFSTKTSCARGLVVSAGNIKLGTSFSLKSLSCQGVPKCLKYRRASRSQHQNKKKAEAAQQIVALMDFSFSPSVAVPRTLSLFKVTHINPSLLHSYLLEKQKILHYGLV